MAALLPGDHEPSMAEEVGVVQDDRLRLIFTCCHPALFTQAQVALTLRLLGGLSTTQVTRSFLVAEPTMARRLVRILATLLPDEPEVAGLLALLLLTESRRASRLAPEVPWCCSASRTALAGIGP